MRYRSRGSSRRRVRSSRRRVSRRRKTVRPLKIGYRM